MVLQLLKGLYLLKRKPELILIQDDEVIKVNMGIDLWARN
jgi:hypothetical protein